MKLVAFEGIDSAGKETQVKLAEKYLTERGYKVVCEHFPRYDTPVGDLIRKYLWKEIRLTTEAFHLLFEVDKADYQERITFHEKLGVDFLLLDRYLLSNLAYGMANGVPISWLKNIESNFRKPDMTLIFDISATTAYYRRIINHDEYETDVLFQNRTRMAYHHLGNKLSSEESEGLFFFLDADKSPEEIHMDVCFCFKRLGV